jgi:hypothetical protein
MTRARKIAVTVLGTVLLTAAVLWIETHAVTTRTEHEMRDAILIPFAWFLSAMGLRTKWLLWSAAALQMPIYGAMFAVAWMRHDGRRMASRLCLIHLLAALLGVVLIVMTMFQGMAG